MRRVSLFWRVFAINAAVLVAAVVGARAVARDGQRAHPRAARWSVLGGRRRAACWPSTCSLLRRVFGPLEQPDRADAPRRPARPGPADRARRAGGRGRRAEPTRSTTMLDRLERERRDSGRRALDAQEEERRRIARELHDEIGQTLTGVVLQLETLARARARGAARTSLRSREATARGGVEEVREHRAPAAPGGARRLRAAQRAASSLGTELAEHSGLRGRRARLAGDLPALSAEEELVVYRVAQESLTNVVRHARATPRRAQPRADGRRRSCLRVRDDGRGHRRRRRCDSGSGVRGMRERALLVGARARGRAPSRRTAPRCALRLPARTPMTDPADDPRSCSPTTTRSCAAACGWCSTAAPDLERRRRGRRRHRGGRARRCARTSTSPILDVAMPRMTGLQAARELSRRAARPADPDALDARERAVLLRGAEGGRVRLRAQDRRRPRPRRGVPRGDARRAVPLPAAPCAALMRDYLERAADGDACARSRSPPRELEVVKLVAEAHTSERDRRAADHQPARPSSATARTSSASSACATASSSPATRSAAGWSSRERPRLGARRRSRCGTSPCCCPIASTAGSSAPSSTPWRARAHGLGAAGARRTADNPPGLKQALWPLPGALAALASPTGGARATERDGE